MHRRPLGGGRRLAFLAAIILIVGCILPWSAVGGGVEQLPTVYRGLGDTSGLLSFLAALATLALIALPYAAGDQPVPVDRGIVFGVLAGAALLGVVLWIPNVIDAPQSLLPDRAYGFWIAAVGAVMLARAAGAGRQPPR